MTPNPYDDPESVAREDEYRRQAEFQEAAGMPPYHHPDCQCNACYYGEDLARWAFHASEY